MNLLDLKPLYQTLPFEEQLKIVKAIRISRGVKKARSNKAKSKKATTNAKKSGGYVRKTKPKPTDLLAMAASMSPLQRAELLRQLKGKN